MWKTSCKSVSARRLPFHGPLLFTEFSEMGQKKRERSCFRSFWRLYNPNGASVFILSLLKHKREEKRSHAEKFKAIRRFLIISESEKKSRICGFMGRVSLADDERQAFKD